MTARSDGGKEMKRTSQELNYIGQIPIEAQKTSVNCVKCWHMEYCMANKGRTIFYAEHKKIDYESALRELSKLDWTYLNNGISFINSKTQSSLFFRRTKLNLWYVQTAAHDHNGNFRTAVIDSNNVFSWLRLFFEESPWFEATGWHLEPDLFEVYG